MNIDLAHKSRKTNMKCKQRTKYKKSPKSFFASEKMLIYANYVYVQLERSTTGEEGGSAKVSNGGLALIHPAPPLPPSNWG